MEATQEAEQLRTNLAELRTNSLRALALFAGVVTYLWLMSVIWPVTGRAAPDAARVGSSLCFLGVLVGARLTSKYLDVGAIVLVAATLLGITSAILAYRMPELAYLLVLSIIYTSVLLDQRAVFLVASAACTLLLVTCVGALHLMPLSLAVVLPLCVIAVTALASWLSGRNLYIALSWVWHGYSQAHRNERLAREQQAELRRALKALDEATYRVERTNYMLSIARNQAEEARRLKQQFAQTISHELRTPLNLIVSFTDLMAQSPEYYGGSLPPAYARDLGIVLRNARHLQSLVNDVLDLARIEAAQMSILQEETEPQALVKEAVNAVRSLVEARGLEMQLDVEPDLPCLWIDPGRIRQVLFNLLANAVRFTEQGSISLSVHREGEEVHFAVADTGVGIAEEDRPFIFEEFRQADGSSRRRHGGAGLGLAISKQFVALHGGRIWVESELSRGSTFHFCLPTARTDPLAEAKAQSLNSSQSAFGPSGEEPILLVVTRSTAAAALLTRYVHGCRTVVAQDLEQAERTARQLLPQGIVIDANSVEIAGPTLQEIAHQWDLPRTPFLASPLPGEEVSRRELAVDGYLVKPVSRQSLWDVLRQFGEDVDKVLVIDDDPDFVRLMGRLLDSPLRRYQVVNAYSGHEGLEMVHYHRPDLVLLDLVLPDISGTRVIEQLRTDTAWQDLPIVVVSGQDEIGSVPAMRGNMLATRATGIQPHEVVQWVQHMMGVADKQETATGGGHHPSFG